MKHTCHAKGCDIEIEPRRLMCLAHWKMVPRKIQREIWAAYVPGQEIRKDPTRAYLDVMERAIDAVFTREYPGEVNLTRKAARFDPGAPPLPFTESPNAAMRRRANEK